MFQNKKLSILIPIFTSTLLYLLFIIFGVSEDKMNIIIATPIAAAFWFFGVFFVIYIQVKNSNCPEGFLNFIEQLLIYSGAFFGFSGKVPFFCAYCTNSELPRTREIWKGTILTSGKICAIIISSGEIRSLPANQRKGVKK